jgi:diketogulonate reductase-like aldo/keto reductase
MTNGESQSGGLDYAPLGLGTWEMSSVWIKDDPGNRYDSWVVGLPGVSEDREIAALLEGIDRYGAEGRPVLVDTGEIYGNGYTNWVVGEALAQRDSSRYRIVGKVWEANLGSTAAITTALQAMTVSLRAEATGLHIGMPHNPVTNWRELAPGFRQAIDHGLIQAVGVSNTDLDQLQAARRVFGADLQMVQAEYNVLTDGPCNINKAYLDYCQQQDITVVAHQPLARGAVFHDRHIVEAAQQHTVTPAQYALASLIVRDVIAIPKSSSVKHIQENAGAIAFARTLRSSAY